MSVVELCAWLQNSPVGLLVRESLWGFPIIVAIHIVGLTMSAGLIAFFDLRLLGVWLTGCPVSLSIAGCCRLRPAASRSCW